MVTPFDKLAFETAQAARLVWFFGHKALAARLTRPVPTPPKLRGRSMPDRQRLLADLWRLVEQDWHNIEAGLYAPPEDWRGNPLDGLRRAVDFFADLNAVEARRHGEAGEALLRHGRSLSATRAITAAGPFPERRLPERSLGRALRLRVEVLFGGGAAAMRRQALVPLRAAPERAIRAGRRQGAAARYRLRHRRFLREVKRNHPRLAVTGLDLSGPSRGWPAAALPNGRE